MKKQLALGMGLAVLSTSAFATKARLLSLGQDKSGSQYIMDQRNIFLNSAYAAKYKDMVIFEWGDDGRTGVPSLIADDQDRAPQAEGGFLKSAGNFVYGVYFGGESDITNELRGYSHVGDREYHQDNQLDLFFAGSTSSFD